MKDLTTFDNVAACQRANPEARLRLFCFPFAGGGSGTFNSWVDELPLDVQRETELWSIRLPGHEVTRGGPLLTRLSPLLAMLAPAIKSSANTPSVFFGHSMGALVSFELARALRRQQIPGPIHIVVSGHRAPQLPDPHPAIHQLPDSEFLANLRVLGGTPDAVLQNSELVELFLPVLRADFAICESYRYTQEEPLDCSITAFGGKDDNRVSREELVAWRTQSRRSFSLSMFPGDHFFLQSAKTLVLQVLAQDLRQILRRLPSQV